MTGISKTRKAVELARGTSGEQCLFARQGTACATSIVHEPSCELRLGNDGGQRG